MHNNAGGSRPDRSTPPLFIDRLNGSINGSPDRPIERIQQELAAQDVFKKVVLVGRRQVELPKGPGYDKMVRAFRMLDVCVCWREQGASLCGPLGRSDSFVTDTPPHNPTGAARAGLRQAAGGGGEGGPQGLRRGLLRAGHDPREERRGGFVCLLLGHVCADSINLPRQITKHTHKWTGGLHQGGPRLRRQRCQGRQGTCLLSDRLVE